MQQRKSYQDMSIIVSRNKSRTTASGRFRHVSCNNKHTNKVQMIHVYITLSIGFTATEYRDKSLRVLPKKTKICHDYREHNTCIVHHVSIVIDNSAQYINLKRNLLYNVINNDIK
jgi:hypothetical protein